VTKHDVMKAYRGVGGKVLNILHLGIMTQWSASRSRGITTRGRQYSLHRRVGGSQHRPANGDEEENPTPDGNLTWVVQFVASHVTD
jgi:hypothetical protein